MFPTPGFPLERAKTVAVVIVLMGMALTVAPAIAEDADQIRYYLGVRLGQSLSITEAHDAAGLSLGANLGRYLGAGIALDKYELHIDSDADAKVGEVQVFSILAEIRLRYPLLADRLVPYLLGGLGPSIDHINDVTVPSRWSGGGADRVRLVGAIGAGIEYYVTDDIAFGVEGKYYMLGSATYETVYPPSRVDVDMNAGVVTLGMRLLFPELHPDERAFSPEGFTKRIYFDVRMGGALMTQNQVFPGVKTKQSHSIFGSDFGRLYAAAIGVHLTPWVDVELAGSYNELSLEYPNGRHSEYAMFPILLQSRLHYPIEASRWARWDPYVSGGVGPQLVEINDKGGYAPLDVKGSRVAVIGSVGAGLDYRLTRDISVGLETKYIISRGQTLTVGDGAERQGNLDSLLIAIGVRAYFGEL